MAQGTRLDVTLTVEESGTGSGDLGPGSDTARIAKALVLSAGTGADQADRCYAKSRTVNASTTDTLDVATGGGLTDIRGQALALAKVKAIVIRNTHATQAITLTRPAANGVPIFAAAGDAVTIPAGGVFALAAPGAAGLATVTGGTGDLIDIVNGAGSSATYEIAIVGTSA